jgi:hypothetical protein
MTTLQPIAQKWICDGCGVAASRLDGRPATEPRCWSQSKQGRLCLACRRDRAGEAALDRAPLGISRSNYRQIHRNGLIEFEIRRTPNQRNSSIAAACGTSPKMVAEVRRNLDATNM